MKYEIDKVYSWKQPNDGKCPLPEGSTGTVIFRCGGFYENEDFDTWDWQESGDYTIVAFIPKYIPKKPLEVWINIYKDGSMGGAHKTKEDAVFYGGLISKIVHFREVKE